MVLYVAARLAFPDSSEPQDLRKYYASVSGRLWMLVAAFFACALATIMTRRPRRQSQLSTVSSWGSVCRHSAPSRVIR